MGPHAPLLASALIGFGAAVSTPAAAAPHTYTIMVDKMKFGPVPTGLRAGDRIIWVNRDFLRHSATAAEKSFDLDLPPSSRRVLVVRRGTFHIICKYHPGMRTTLKVVD